MLSQSSLSIFMQRVIDARTIGRKQITLQTTELEELCDSIYVAYKALKDKWNQDDEWCAKYEYLLSLVRK